MAKPVILSPFFVSSKVISALDESADFAVPTYLPTIESTCAIAVAVPNANKIINVAVAANVFPICLIYADSLFRCLRQLCSFVRFPKHSSPEQQHSQKIQVDEPRGLPVLFDPTHCLPISIHASTG